MGDVTGGCLDVALRYKARIERCSVPTRAGILAAFSVAMPQNFGQGTARCPNGDFNCASVAFPRTFGPGFILLTWRKEVVFAATRKYPIELGERAVRLYR